MQSLGIFSFKYLYCFSLSILIDSLLIS